MSSFRDLELRDSYFPQDRPLDSFYVHALGAAEAYDRIAGYFRSTALAAASAGVSRFIAGGGAIRMIVGAQLDPSDLDAVLEGDDLAEVVARRLERSPLEAADAIAEDRLAVLAWLVREGRLQIKVGVPTDEAGRPLPPEQAQGYFHAKLGVLRDPAGDGLAFAGSINESAAAWVHNLEQLDVYRSWEGEIWGRWGQPIVDRFERFWVGTPDKGWAILDLPEAARADLIKRAPPEGIVPSRRDPAEAGATARRDRGAEAAILTYVRDAPRLDGGSGVGIATAGASPFPHQLAIAERSVATFPRGYLLADEVGLGKTIEAGLILRELLVSGRAETALLLVPASVMRQWQQELQEKIGLEVPRYERGKYLDAADAEVSGANSGSAWKAFPVLLASSHLARRRGRREELLTAGGWDIVLVDEAHHARRRGRTDEPNALLRLLRELRDSRAWKALYLASATPMQMHAHEAWDLLDLLGLPGGWGESEESFVAYFAQLRERYDDRDWDLLSRLSRDYRGDPAAGHDGALEVALKEQLGMAGSRAIRMIGAEGIEPAAAKALPVESRGGMDEWLRAHNPMRDRVFRTTRDTLRRYKADGMLPPDVNIPKRSVQDRFVPMTDHEAALYERIETYISRFYDAFREATGDERRALGFIVTVYRRRLTSSFEAVERSLRRRLEALEAGAGLDDLLDADDYAALEGSLGDESDQKGGLVRGLGEEIAELRAFLRELEKRPPNESKMDYLLNEFDEAFAGAHDTVVVFTQYTDTLDYIRGQLVTQFGSRVGCYSGRGGELWDPALREWVRAPKETVKTQFRDGKLKVLIGTDSLSEGLNLQTCGRLFNYDMPWNFMRVEQRIGRVDRIGGQPRVEISNYFYSDTVEEQIYRGIAEDFEWFEDVVGPAQPVLNQVEEAIEAVAVQQPSAERARLLAERVTEIRAEIEAARDRSVSLDDMVTPELAPTPLEPAIDLPLLERALIRVGPARRRLRPHPDIGGAYVLSRPGLDPASVTFRREVLEEHAPAVRLLTYLSPELEALLSEAADELDVGGSGDGLGIRDRDELRNFLEDR